MYVRAENNQVVEYPYTIQQLKAKYSNTSFFEPVTDEVLASYSVFPVKEVKRPVRIGGNKVVEALPQKINGVWTQVWEQIPFTVAELNEIKVNKITEVKALRDQKIHGDGYQVNGKWYHSDTTSRIQQIGLVMMGANMPSGLQWKTMDGTFVTMTPTLATQIFAAAAAKDQALFAYAEYLIGQVNQSGDPLSVQITEGWPIGYGDVSS